MTTIFEKLFGRRDRNLYVITTHFNPHGYQSRLKLFNEFKERMLKTDGVQLVVVEATLRHSPKEIRQTKEKNFHVVHVNADCEIWLKENLINIGIEYLYKHFHHWKYVAIIDGDILLVRPDWVRETKRLLGQQHVIQMFSHVTHLNSSYQPMHGHNLSFMEGWRQELHIKNKKPSGEDPSKIRYGWCGAPGAAWAFSRKCIDKIFPLLDIGILGSGDFHMACCLMGYVDLTFTYAYSDAYRQAIIDWQDRVQWLNGDIGMMRGLLIHYWHGALKNRGYETRWNLIVKHKFDPHKDLRKNKDGVYFIPHKEQLVGDIKKYFESRKEDEI